MTASPAASLAPRELSRSLTPRFSALLFLFLALSGGTYFAVSSAVSAKEYDSVVVNLAGRQRMLTQKYALEIHEVLVALDVSDLELAEEMKEAASQTAGVYEETLAAFREGGKVDAGDEGRIWIPPVQGVDLVEHMGHVKAAWETLRGTASRAMRSHSPSAAGEDHFRNIQTQTAKAVTEMDHVVWLMQKQSEARLRRVDSYMVGAFILSVVLFAGTVVFVHRTIVVPLANSMANLSATNERYKNEIAQRKQAEAVEAARTAELEQRTIELEKSHRTATGLMEDAERARKAAEEAREELRLQGAALAATANTIVITDRSGCIAWVNPAFTKLTGYTSDEVIGRNMRMLKSGKHDDAFYGDIWNTILAGEA